jgi:hypothetical protein
MTTSTVDGLQLVASTYLTEKVIVVEGEPDPGDAVPELSTGAGCDAPLQLAARATSAATGDNSATIALETARMVTAATRRFGRRRRFMK